MKKEEKIGLTPVNWILSIVGILLFASCIILPPVFRAVFKKEVTEKKPEEKVVVNKMICTRENYVVGNHIEKNTIEITYSKDSLRTYKKHTEESFKTTGPYEEEKQSKGKLTTAYSLVDGVIYNFSPKDRTLSIIIDEEFDLGVFKDDKVKLPETEEEIEVKSPYKLGDSVTGITSNLTNENYNCKVEEKK